ncbi:MAG: phosphoribosylformylglycinamidine synthase subunit PurQ [Acidobacteria bacterium]|nr:phosphoribosylformylglycinamidine synthase subunit PurQ [Acidobacteriota bacterium]MBV9068206.1 phosphoribosylformylglycinamidine synthase subunit PurQ [Acidobacteriota bacterium]MBV9186497.1 phosphoribosylformylglycinamidine synthase subunit PurQ [Acidobacteriota bacterium]
MKFGVVVLPGSNCDHDAVHVVRDVLGAEVELLWHKETDLRGADCVIVPGGFSYGDYLRAGALAKFAPVMEPIRRHAAAGGMVFGICNGFQVLTEVGLLPGALMRNQHLRFLGRDVFLRVEETDTPFTCELERGAVLRVPIAHGEGNYFADDSLLDDLERNRQVIFRYCDAEGRITHDANPNGSARNIAGICNAGRNVLGMMPHPERCAETLLGNTDGLGVFRSIAAAMAKV